jgi:hypothetical protein
MVGGAVIEVRQELVSGRPAVRIWCVDRNGDEAAIYVAMPEGGKAQVFDQVWWQGRTAFWTAQGGKSDVPLPRIGNSFDPRPKVA